MNQAKSIKNLFYGLLCFAVTTILGIVIPRLFITSYGSEMNGLLSSVKQIMSYLSLLEAGIGGATIQALYAPVGRNDRDRINAVMTSSNRFYRRTGLIYGGCVLLLAIVYPLVIQTEVPPLVVACIILLQGESGVITYLLTANVQCLMQVDGKKYIFTNITTVLTILKDAVQILLILLGAPVLLIQAAFCILGSIQVAFILLYARRNYPWLNVRHKQPDEQAIEQKNSVLVHQVSTLVFNGTDTVLLSLFCNLKLVSVYTMYSMVYNMIATAVYAISSSFSFILGQLFDNDRKRFRSLFAAYETYFFAICFSLMTCAFLFILPFLRLYTEGVTDIEYVDAVLPILFSTTFLLNYIRIPCNSVITFAGHFKKTQWRAILEVTINILVSLIAVQFLGIYGVLLGTICGLLYRTNDIILYVDRAIEKGVAKNSYRRIALNSLLMVVCCFVGRILPQSYSGYMSLILCAAAVCIVLVVLFLTVNTLVEREARSVAWQYIKPYLKRKK